METSTSHRDQKCFFSTLYSDGGLFCYSAWVCTLSLLSVLTIVLRLFSLVCFRLLCYWFVLLDVKTLFVLTSLLLFVYFFALCVWIVFCCFTCEDCIIALGPHMFVCFVLFSFWLCFAWILLFLLHLFFCFVCYFTCKDCITALGPHKFAGRPRAIFPTANPHSVFKNLPKALIR